MTVSNRDRANWAEEAIDHFAGIVGQRDEDLATNTGDLLCDIMHLCDFENLDFSALLDRARGHYDEECAEEYPAKLRDQPSLF